MAKVLSPLCAPGCQQPVHEDGRCRLHWLRAIEREEYRRTRGRAGRDGSAGQGDKSVRQCTVRSCGRPSKTRGLGLSHYERWRKRQTLDTPILPWDQAQTSP